MITMKKYLRNHDIRMKMRGIPIWKLAELMGISENTLSRWLRYELDNERKTALVEAIHLINMAVEAEIHDISAPKVVVKESSYNLVHQNLREEG